MRASHILMGALLTLAAGMSGAQAARSATFEQCEKPEYLNIASKELRLATEQAVQNVRFPASKFAGLRNCLRDYGLWNRNAKNYRNSYKSVRNWYGSFTGWDHCDYYRLRYAVLPLQERRLSELFRRFYIHPGGACDRERRIVRHRVMSTISALRNWINRSHAECRQSELKVDVRAAEERLLCQLTRFERELKEGSRAFE